ncbi:MAG: hypothetical protein ACJ735_06240 [Actinomycetes bacterium]
MSQHTWRAIVVAVAVVSCITACTGARSSATAPRPLVSSAASAASGFPAASPLPDGGYYAPIAVVVSGAPARVAAGGVFTLQVRTSSGYASGEIDGVDWGDGTQVLIASAGPECGSGTSQAPLAPLPAPEPGSATDTYRHVYFSGGTRLITVSAGWPSFCGGKPRLRGSGRATLTVEVAGTPLPGNGPNDPVPTIGITPFAHSNSLTGDAYATDPDGYIRTLVLDLGDGGGGPRTYTDTAPCLRPSPGWHDSAFRVPWRHTFRPGRHTITVRATSTDCDGRNTQTITAYRTIEVTQHGSRDIDPLSYSPHDPYQAQINDTIPTNS